MYYKWNVFSVAVLLFAFMGCKTAGHVDLRPVYGGAVMKIKGPRGGCTAWSTRLPVSNMRVTVTNSHCAAIAHPVSHSVIAIQQDGSSERLVLLYDSPYTDISVFSGAKFAKQDLEIGELNKAGRLSTIGHPGLRGLTQTDGDFIEEEVVKIPNMELTREQCNTPKNHMETITAFFGLIETDMCITTISAIGTDMAYYPGNSGSPVLQGGKVVGIAFASNSDASAGYMIESEWIKRTLYFVDAEQSLSRLFKDSTEESQGS